MEVKKKIAVLCALFALLVALVPPSSAKAEEIQTFAEWCSQESLEFAWDSSDSYGSGYKITEIYKDEYSTIVVKTTNKSTGAVTYWAYFTPVLESYFMLWLNSSDYSLYFHPEPTYSSGILNYYSYYWNNSTGGWTSSKKNISLNLTSDNELGGRYGGIGTTVGENTVTIKEVVYTNRNVVYRDGSIYKTPNVKDVVYEKVDVGEVLVPILQFITNFFEYSFVAFGYEISIGAIVIFSIMGGMLILFMRR